MQFRFVSNSTKMLKEIKYHAGNKLKGNRNEIPPFSFTLHFLAIQI